MMIRKEEIDIVCKVAIALKKSPYTYTDNEMFFVTTHGKLIIDFKLKEMKFVNWDYYDEEIELQLMGICKMYRFEAQDYIE